MRELLYKDEVYQVMGAAMEVHSQLGHGFLEPVYQEALSIEFRMRKIPFTAQPQLDLTYKQYHLEKCYVPDFVVFSKIIVEIKALEHLTQRETAQLLNYLKVTGFELGLLINFGAESLEWQRKIMTKENINSHSNS